MLKRIASLLLVSFVAACGGGGGDAGTSPFGSGSGSGTGTGSGGTAATYLLALDVQRAGVSTSQISSTETTQAVATVTNSSGTPIEGVVVSFAQGSAGPSVAFAPAAATALTDASGRAAVDLGAATSSATGAATITAAATVGGTALTASKAVQISAGAVTGTPATPAAINFVGSVPSGTAIVVKGTGGNGRSESAVLSFRVVDASNAPINAVAVNFALNSSNGGAKLQQDQAVTNSDGQVSVTVSSGTSPSSIVVTASVASTAILAQSDTLIVSNSVPVSGGFEIVAEKYNLDGRKTGDSTKISAYVRDQFGNPVPDGVAVNFTTDFGAVASSTLGGCTTVNGICTVVFRVQDPRPATNGIATVTGVVRVGSSTQLVQTLSINMAGATGTPYLALGPSGTAPITQLTLTTCKQSFELRLSDGSNFSPAAGTTIASSFASTDVNITVKSGSPVLDQLTAGYPPTGFGLEVDLSAATLVPKCDPLGAVKASGLFFRLEYKTPGGVVFSQRIDLNYPQ